jgi:isochorismate synthase
VTALAGSFPRGATVGDDQALGAQLLASAKERHEHAVVVRNIRSVLADLCMRIEAPATPTLMKMRNVQHLFTPVTAQLRGNSSVLTLVERLHPTPAVGGWPREVALAFLREHEELDRGWYAAPIGWLDANGDGEFAVALRSALVDGTSATLFAGCGIVADSDPQSEYQETLLKLRPMLNALRP